MTNTPGSVDPPEFDVVFEDDAIEPGATVAPAGEVAFVVMNEGAHEHDFVLAAVGSSDEAIVREGHLIDSDAQIIGHIGPLAHGEERRALFALEPGRYVISCRTPGHGGIGGGLELTVQPR